MDSLKEYFGKHDIVFITLDTLRYDVAQAAIERQTIPNIASRLPDGWELRHTPATFTYAAHHAFFAGFLPTPAKPGPHSRLFAAKFHGSESTTDHTFVFEEADLPTALANRGYKTICIGGVGFFNKQTHLGSVLPALFQQSYWDMSMSVTSPTSAENQIAQALRCLQDIPNEKLFLFLNISAMHQPNYFYLPGAKEDSTHSQLAALQYVDRWLGVLWKHLEARGAGLCILCSDHGTAYGEEGYTGHRLAHRVVWEVPYAEFTYPQEMK